MGVWATTPCSRNLQTPIGHLTFCRQSRQEARTCSCLASKSLSISESVSGTSFSWFSLGSPGHCISYIPMSTSFPSLPATALVLFHECPFAGEDSGYSLWRDTFINSFLMGFAFDVISKANPEPNWRPWVWVSLPNPKSPRFSLLLSSQSFRVLHFPFWVTSCEEYKVCD